jgi:folate-binding protein YgfZ
MNPAIYEAARAAAVRIPRHDRAIVALEGRDPGAMLQGLLSNDVRPVAAGRCVYGTLLTPKGGMIAELRAFGGDDDAILMDVPADALDAITAHFARFVPPRMARLRPSSHAVLGLYGPATISRATPLLGGTSPSVDENASTPGPDGLLALGTRYAGVPGVDLVGPRERLDETSATLAANGVTELDPATLEVLRIEAGSPRWGAELHEGRIPLEAGLGDRAISQTKGCYTGQEVIVRILHRGHVNWHLRGFESAGDSAEGSEAAGGAAGGSEASDAGRTGSGRPSPPPFAPGQELTQPGSDRVVARLTSAAVSPRLGPIALGYGRRELEAGATLRTPAGGAARMVVLPFEGR